MNITLDASIRLLGEAVRVLCESLPVLKKYSPGSVNNFNQIHIHKYDGRKLIMIPRSMIGTEEAITRLGSSGGGPRNLF